MSPTEDLKKTGPGFTQVLYELSLHVGMWERGIIDGGSEGLPLEKALNLEDTKLALRRIKAKLEEQAIYEPLDCREGHEWPLDKKSINIIKWWRNETRQIPNDGTTDRFFRLTADKFEKKLKEAIAEKEKWDACPDKRDGECSCCDCYTKYQWTCCIHRYRRYGEGRDSAESWTCQRI